MSQHSPRLRTKRPVASHPATPTVSTTVSTAVPEAAQLANDLLGELTERFAALKTSEPDADPSEWNVVSRSYALVGEHHFPCPRGAEDLSGEVLARFLSWCHHAFGVDGFVAIQEGIAVLPDTPDGWKALAEYRANGGQIPAHPDAKRTVLALAFCAEGVFQHAVVWPKDDVPGGRMHRSASTGHPVSKVLACPHYATVGDES